MVIYIKVNATMVDLALYALVIIIKEYARPPTYYYVSNVGHAQVISQLMMM